MPRVNGLVKGSSSFSIIELFLIYFLSYKEANESMRRKQDKDREANGIAPPVRGGATRGAPSTRARGAPNRGSSAPGRAISRGGGGGGFSARGGGSGRNVQGRGDSTLWIHLIGMLKKKELLPVVVFTFSKKRCEENAGSMPNTDLCSSAEKSEVHLAIERSLVRLKGTLLVR